MSTLGRLSVMAFGIVVAYLLLWPVSIDPVSWEAPEAPALEGRFAVNDLLADATLISTGNDFGPEDVAVDRQGRMYVGTQQGRILRYTEAGDRFEVFAETGGRPLGLDFDSSGNLIVADAHKGLLSVNPQGEVTILCTEVDGLPFLFTDDVDVDEQDVAWFSDASFRFGPEKVRDDIIESAPNGRLLRYDLRSGACELVLGGLFFANGVAVSPDGQYVLVNETTRYRVRRVFVRGPRAGENEVFMDELPGFPDGISTGQGGVFWLAFFAPRNETLDRLSGRPWLREVLQRLPIALQPQPERHPFVIGIDAEAQVVYNLQDSAGERFAATTSAEQVGEWLYIGSLSEPNFARISLASVPSQ
jgi:sugar lactone lactonase YvrE